MPLFKPTLVQQYTPKKIKLDDLYRANTGGQNLSLSQKEQAMSALKKAGWDEEKIRQTVFNNKPVAVSEMKQLASVLNNSRLFGFEKDQSFAIKNFLNKERVKAQNIAKIRKEHVLERMAEETIEYGTTSLNPKGVSPNASIKKSDTGRAVRSLSGKTSSQPISSFGGGGNKPASGLGGTKSSAFRPRF